MDKDASPPPSPFSPHTIEQDVRFLDIFVFILYHNKTFRAK